METIDLVERAQAGDVSAFAGLYQQHHRRIYALCLRMTADTGLAEDLTQDTFVQAWRNLGDYRGNARFSTWLHRIAVNAVLSLQRRHSPWLIWRRIPMEDHPEPADPTLPPDGMLDLENAIARLPMRARQVFVLVDIEGYSHQEAATTLDVAVGTSKAHLFRARSLLKEMLS